MNQNANDKTRCIEPIPIITSSIKPEDIDGSRPILGGFGSAERETIAQAAVIICQERGSWHWAIGEGELKLVLQRLGEENLANPMYDLEGRGSPILDGLYCPNVGDGRLLQKIAKDLYAVTDEFIESCYQRSPLNTVQQGEEIPDKLVQIESIIRKTDREIADKSNNSEKALRTEQDIKTLYQRIHQNTLATTALAASAYHEISDVILG